MGFYDYLSKEHQIKRCKNNNGKTTLKALSSKTILEHHRLIRAMLQNAVYWQILPYNPVARVKPPKHTKTKINYYDETDCKQLLEALTGEDLKFQTIIILTLFTGMRKLLFITQGYFKFIIEISSILEYKKGGTVPKLSPIFIF